MMEFPMHTNEYTAPSVSELGSMSEIVQFTGTGSNNDGELWNS
jgi:hypothetical protein